MRNASAVLSTSKYKKRESHVVFNALAILLSIRLYDEIQPHEKLHHIRTQAIVVLLLVLATKYPLLLRQQLFALLSLSPLPYQPRIVSVVPMSCCEITSLRNSSARTRGCCGLNGYRLKIRQIEGRRLREEVRISVTGTGAPAIVATHAWWRTQVRR